VKLDSTDIRIIKLLQKDARASIASIARHLRISPNATHARYKKIQRSGIIKKTFIPTYLPQYASGKTQAYKKQIIIRSTNREVERIVKFIQNVNLEHSQIECWETIGHYNILVWIISENPIDLHLIKDKILSQPGVLEAKAAVVSDMVDYSSQIDLHHLAERKRNG
jgi:Lrp/AsnC family leucine-responsive transcriptional regulator